jgi:methyl-accepting chemotaxis protein
VVANEVRNLALRAADAAKNTAALIEGTVKRVNEGSGLLSRTNEAFNEVAGSAVKVGELVAEIAAASSEQAQGIEQLNRAVAEMDNVVQQNASSAEESAAAAEKMSVQAGQMKGIAGELVLLVSGKGARAAKAEESLRSSRDGEISKALKMPQEPLKASSMGMAPVPRKGKEVTPEQVIPLKEEEFRDF